LNCKKYYKSKQGIECGIMYLGCAAILLVLWLRAGLVDELARVLEEGGLLVEELVEGGRIVEDGRLVEGGVEDLPVNEEVIKELLVVDIEDEVEVETSIVVESALLGLWDGDRVS
jgi:hypothetical protein